MGLDMYLFKFKRCGDIKDDLFLILLWEIFSTDNITNMELKSFLNKYSYQNNQSDSIKNVLIKKIAYWRKANMVHNWIYKNCGSLGQRDCDLIIVTREKLEELLNICILINNNEKEIIAGTSDLAKEILPTKTGFFFGSLNYDEGYISDIKDTIDIINDVLQNTADNEVIVYIADY